MNKIYVVFGTDLVSEMKEENPNHEEVAKMIKDNGGGMIKEYEENTSISEVLEDADGWYSNMEISESDYKKILSFHKD